MKIAEEILVLNLKRMIVKCS